jgi:hypothetical protein
VMSRIKAVYRGQAILHAGKTIYSKRRRQQWLEQLAQPGLRRRAQRLYQQLDVLRACAARHVWTSYGKGGNTMPAGF